ALLGCLDSIVRGGLETIGTLVGRWSWKEPWRGRWPQPLDALLLTQTHCIKGMTVIFGRLVASLICMSVLVERVGAVTTVMIARPEVRNAVDGATAGALADAFREFDADPDSAVAVLAGSGGTFCSGADLRAVGTAAGNKATADGDGPMGPTR